MYFSIIFLPHIYQIITVIFSQKIQKNKTKQGFKIQIIYLYIVFHTMCEINKILFYGYTLFKVSYIVCI